MTSSADPAVTTSTGRPKQPLTPKGARTKKRILDAALELFARSGFNSVSLRSIAAAADMSHAGVLRYFKDKDTLLIAVLERRDKLDLGPAIDGDTLRPEILTKAGSVAFFEAFLQVIERNSQIPEIIELFLKVAAEASEPDHPAHEYFVDRYASLIDVLRQVFEVALPGTPGERLGAQTAAEQFIAIVDGSQLQWLLSPDRFDLVAETRRYLEFLGVLDTAE